jgi:hypothetical protein
MNELDALLDKLQRIQQLWVEVGRTKSDTPEYKTLMDKLRVLSAEYQALVDSAKKPKD